MKLRGILYYSLSAGHTAAGQSQAGRRLARECIDALRAAGAGSAGSGPVQLEFPPRGKPRCPGGPDFSISHSGPLVACAAVSHGAVGLDLECDPAVERLTLATICDDAERDLARRIGTHRLWLAKEAALKAGGGTIEHIAAVRVFEGGAVFGGVRYHGQHVALGSRWPACIMTSLAGVPFEVRSL